MVITVVNDESLIENNIVNVFSYDGEELLAVKYREEADYDVKIGRAVIFQEEPFAIKYTKNMTESFKNEQKFLEKMIPVIGFDGNPIPIAIKHVMRMIREKKIAAVVSEENAGRIRSSVFKKPVVTYRFVRQRQSDEVKEAQIRERVSSIVDRYIQLKEYASELKQCEESLRNAATEICCLREEFQEVIVFDKKIQVDLTGTGKRQLDVDAWKGFANAPEREKVMGWMTLKIEDNIDAAKAALNDAKISYTEVFYPDAESALKQFTSSLARDENGYVALAKVKKIRKLLNLSEPAIKILKK